MKTKDRATENLLKIALGEAAPTEHLDRRDAMAELLRRLYSQDQPCTEWGEGVETRLESLDDSVTSLSTAHNKVADRVDAIREWCDRVDAHLDELHDRVAEAKAGASPMPVTQVMDTITYHAERASELTEKALEASGDEREDYIAAAKIHNQTARALSVVVDHKREVAS